MPVGQRVVFGGKGCGMKGGVGQRVAKVVLGALPCNSSNTCAQSLWGQAYEEIGFKPNKNPSEAHGSAWNRMEAH